MQDHLEYACSKIKLTCTECGAAVSRSNMNYHKRVECTRVQVGCVKGCEEVVEREQLVDHLRERCCRRKYRCLKCGEVLDSQGRESH